MNQDQARRMAEEVELPEPCIQPLDAEFRDVLYYYTETQVREAIAAALVKLTQGQEPLSFEQVEDCFPDGAGTDEHGRCVCSAQWLHDFAQAVHRRHPSVIPSQQEERVRELERQCSVMRNGLTDISNETYDPYTNGAWAKQLAINVLDAARSKEQEK
jgi:hypothetical protein